MARTNSLCVFFSEVEPVSVAVVYKELGQFGELARVEVPPGQHAVAVVSFYDIRAASRAKAALGGRCAEAPQYGERTVLLKGDVQIHAWMISEVSAVRRSSDGSAYFLDFFDTRAAERSAAQLDARSITEPEEPPPEKDALAAEANGNGHAGAPKYRNDLRLSQVNWGDLASGRDKRTTLRLRLLPSILCDEETLNRMFSRAGFSQVVDFIRVFPGEGKRPGSALINMVDAASAAAVGKYMHGRQWGARSMPVSVSFAAVQGAVEVRKAFPTATTRAQNLAKVAEAEPWRVECCGRRLRSINDLGASEASTEAGDETELGTCDAVYVEAMSISAGTRA